MNSFREIHVIIRLYFALAFPFLLVVASLRLLLSEQFITFEYKRPGFPTDAYGFDLDDRLAYGAFAVNWLFSDQPIDSLAALRLPAELCWGAAAGSNGCALFSERELTHLVDVKCATSRAFALAAIVGVVGIAIAVHSRRSPKRRCEILAGLRYGAMLSLLSIGCLFVLSFADWDHAFDLFHELFFAAGTWRFPYSDSLIRLYPEQLFIDAGLVAAAATSICAAATLGLLSRWENLSTRRNGVGQLAAPKRGIKARGILR